MVLVKDVLHGLYVGGRAHERVGNEVDVLLYGEQNVVVVFLRDGRQVDVLTRHVHALVGAEHAVVLHLGYDHRAVAACYLHVDLAVVEQDVVAHLHVLGKVGVRHVQNVVGRVDLGTAENAHGVAGLIFDGFFHACCTHLGTLGVDHEGEVWRHLTHVLYDVLYAVGCGVGCVHAHHVHSGKEQLADELFITFSIAN